MMIRSLTLGLTLCASFAALAKATPEQIAALEAGQYSCMGAKLEGTESGVADYTGKFQGQWPGMKKAHGWEPGPYADEQALYVVTDDNMQEYDDYLTDGQKALLRKYPEQYRMRVFPSHRDFKQRDWVCDFVLTNAREAELRDDGLSLRALMGAHPFPFPRNGLEAIWNVIAPHRSLSEKVVYDIANVFANGETAWGRAAFMSRTSFPIADPPPRTWTDQERIAAFFFIHYLLPDREKGRVAVGFQPNSYADESTQAWQYLPGLRRVRKAPEVGYDYPVPPSGMHTSDDDYLFNGSPSRYNWTLIGRKEFLVPYNNFEFNSPQLTYDQIITPHTVNPDFLRYEMHRVWVIEGHLKDGLRHVYKTRRLYVDEDSWLPVWADNFDGRDQLWRTAMVAHFYSQESWTFHRAASVYHDLTSGDYEAIYLTNERDEGWWRLNLPIPTREFSPEAAARVGQ